MDSIIVRLSQATIITNLRRLDLVFSETLKLFGEEPEWKGRTGAYYCLGDPEHGAPRLIVPVGLVPFEKYERYFTNCREKPRRLALNPHFLSSHQNRNPENGEWGGAVRTRGFIDSLSGLPELGDEACMLAMNEGSDTSLQDKIAKFSYNPYWGTLRDRLYR